MPGNIVLCSDGTGQSGGPGAGSNVWRLFEAVDRRCADLRQVTFHLDGVGTEKNRYQRALSGAVGWGLGEDIRQLYAALVRSYQPGDAIFLFGFSRGAFPVRSLAGLIDTMGILRAEQFDSDAALTAAVARTYARYRKTPRPETEFELQESRQIRFVGVWDTVDAIGVPFDELREAIYRVARWVRLPHRVVLNPSIENAYHAIAIDDERRTFHPEVWDENAFEAPVEQVWFAGVHRRGANT